MDHHLITLLQQLNSSYSSSCVRDAVETLLKIHRNIYFNKNDSKYKKLELHNHTFCSKVWDVVPAQQFMLQCGWRQVDNALHFDNDGGLLIIISVLLQHRYVQPKDIEWKAETKIENLHTSKQHEEMLRAKAAVERRKELEEFKKDKLYREQLAEKIKQQIADDRAYNRQLQQRRSVIRQQVADGQNRQLQLRNSAVNQQVAEAWTQNNQLQMTNTVVKLEVADDRGQNLQLEFRSPVVNVQMDEGAQKRQSR